MDIRSLFNQFKFQIYLFLLWIIVFVFVYPIGEFAINDDWSYAKNVYNIVVNKKFLVDQWPAMNLVSQTLFGVIITSIFGFSFSILRTSIFILSITSSLYLFKIVKKISGNNNYLAFVFTAVFIFNSIYMHLSMTYMTDVFFISLLIFAIHALVNYHAQANLNSYIWFCCWCIIAMLCRQQALIFSLLIIPIVLQQKLNTALKILLALIPAFFCWFAGKQYLHYLTDNHIGHNIQQIHHLLEYLKETPIEKHLLQAADLLLVIGWHLLPISVFFLLQFMMHFNLKNLYFFVLFCMVAIAITIKDFGFYPIGNISNMFEIGPRLIKESRQVITDDLAKTLHILCYLISLYSVTIILFYGYKNLKKNRLLFNKLFDKSIYLIIVFIYFFFVAVSNAYFDRYSIPLVLLVLFIVIPLDIEIKKSTKMVTTCFVIMIYVISLIQNIDYFNWQKERRKAICYLNSKGISNNDIDGGFEYNGWIKTNNVYTTDKSMSWWWVVNDNYIVSAKKVEGTSVDTLFIYQRYIPFKKDTVFLLSKIQKK